MNLEVASRKRYPSIDWEMRDGNSFKSAIAFLSIDVQVPALGTWTSIDKKAIADLKEVPSRISQSIEGYRFREATSLVMDLARTGNKYLAETEPWKLAKTDLQGVGTILNLAIQISANLAIEIEPFLPFTSKKMKAMLNGENFDWNKSGSINLLKEGHTLGEPGLLFEKIEDEVI